MIRRLKCLRLTDSLLKKTQDQVVFGPSVNFHELCGLVDLLKEEEQLPRDTIITWLWYDACLGCYCVILWSEMFDIIPECEYAPYVDVC